MDCQRVLFEKEVRAKREAAKSANFMMVSRIRIGEAARRSSRVVAVLLAFVSLGVAAYVQPPNPVIPAGSIVAYPTIVTHAPHLTLNWSIILPDNAINEEYRHFIRQVQISEMVTRDSQVNSEGEQLALLPRSPGGSRFELWTVHTPTSKAHLLASTFVAPYVPTARLTIRSEDPYSALPRTRADRPFFVDVDVAGISEGEGYPESSKGVSQIRHAQSYGMNGTGVDLNRYLATMISQESIETNGIRSSTITVNSIPVVEGFKVRGEERFTITSREDYQMPESILDSKFIQIWPVADATISGLTNGQMIGWIVPEITLTMNDLYPSSITWTHVYKGSPQNGASGITLPGSTVVLNSSIPANRVLKTSNYGSLCNSDGLWTIEILTQTPFGTERLTAVSFTFQSSGTPLENWRQIHFGSMNDSGAGANLEDFDKDGFSNLVEFAFGFDPTKNSAGQLPAPQRTGNNAVVSFTQPAGVSGITYGAEWSATLLPGSWNPVSDSASSPQHSFSVPIGTNQNFFLRLKVMTP